MEDHKFEYFNNDKFGEKLFICFGCNAIVKEREEDYLKLLIKNGCSGWAGYDRGMVVECYYSHSNQWQAVSYASNKIGALEQASSAADRVGEENVRITDSAWEKEIDFTLDN